MRRRWTFVLVSVGLAARASMMRSLLPREPFSVVLAQATAPRLAEKIPLKIEPSVSQVAAVTTRKGLAFQRAQRLRRGLNLSNWYSGTGDYSSARLNAYMSVADMRMIKQLGFDHVRLNVAPEFLIASATSGTLSPVAISRLDQTVNELTGAGLNIVLEMQPEESWKKLLATDDGVENLLKLWTTLASHYSSTDPDRMFFEVMNEPSGDRRRWDEIQARAVAKIRSAVPRHTIIATAPLYDNIEGLLGMELIEDANIIYTFHDYDPMFFTHQGASWSSPALVPLRRIPYPSTPETMKSRIEQEPDERMRFILQRFAWDHWDEQRVGMEVEAVYQWARAHNVPVYCGEFGVYKDYSDPKSRVRWIRDMRKALEARHIGWAMWDYNGNFGLVTVTKQKAGAVDQDVLQALGLGK
jgi:endoglucanase